MSKARELSDLLKGVDVDGDVSFGDNDKAVFGDGSDLQIYHDGSHSWIRDAGSGNLYISSDGYAINFVKGGNAATIAQFIPDGPVNLYNANSLKLATTASGIDVTGTVISTGRFETSDQTVIRSTAATGNNYLDFNTGGAAGNIYIRNGSSFTYHMTIGNSGNLGIGTTSPSRPLHVYSAVDTGLYLQSSDAATSMAMADTGGSVLVGQTSGALQFYTGGDANTAGYLATERLRIDSSGRVGIGTSSPSAFLHLTGNNVNIAFEPTGTNAYLDNRKIGGATNFRVSSSSTNDTTAMTIDSSGNVGIGTSSPDARLSIVDGTSSDQLRMGSVTSYYKIGRNTSTGLLEFNGIQSGFNGYVFGGANGERMRIDSSGRSLFRTTVTQNSSVVVTPDTNRGTIMHVASDSISGTGSAKMMEGAYTVVGNSSNTVLSIPVTSQGSVWKTHFIELSFVTGEYNKSGGTRAGYCKLSLHSLTSLGSLTQHEVGGNVSSVSSSGMNILINFTSGYISGLSDNEGVLVYAKVLSANPDYIQLDNATFN